MIGSLLTRVSVMILGYAYPAYQCYKTIELNKPEIEQLLFWCQYWILVAVLTVFERIGDVLISWLPFYGEIKLAFFVYLWHSKTKGTTYIYNTFFMPYIYRHENDIDRNLLELRTRVTDLSVLYWQKALNNGRSWFFRIMQYIASQPTMTAAEEAKDSRHSAPPPPENQKVLTARQIDQPKAEHTNLAISHVPEHGPSSARLSNAAHGSTPLDKVVVHENGTTNIHSSGTQPEKSIKEAVNLFHRAGITLQNVPLDEMVVHENGATDAHSSGAQPEKPIKESMRLFHRARGRKQGTSTITSVH